MDQPKILSSKNYLYLTEFFSGMGVMAVELAASRLIAPYFSSSQIVWTIIIATIMIAMALGNIWGGKMADRNPDPASLYKRIMISAVWIAAIPVLGKYIILLVTGLLVIAIDTNFLIWAAFVTCMVLFVFPLFLLGTVTPSLVKYSVSNLDSTGTVVGRLGAYNTVGSIIGTFLPTFVTIPSIGTAATFILFSGILLAIGAVFFISSRQKILRTVIFIAVYLVCAVFGCTGRTAFWETGVVYEGESVYNYLQVKQDSSQTILSTNVMFGVQSIKVNGGGLTGMYYDYALMAPALAGVADGSGSVLILGMGTGTYATQCQQYYPDLAVTGVEIDEKITELALTYFDLDHTIPVYTYDGRAFLNTDSHKYDVIMVDAYRDITIPFQMSTIEFFQQVSSHLTPGGVMVVNMNMYSTDPEGINAHLGDTVGAVFSHVYTLEVPSASNMEMFATNNADALTNLTGQLAAVGDVRLHNFLQTNSLKLAAYTAGRLVMTDDKAPVELLGMEVIDAMISNELVYYRHRFWEYGLAGIIG